MMLSMKMELRAISLPMSVSILIVVFRKFAKEHSYCNSKALAMPPVNPLFQLKMEYRACQNKYGPPTKQPPLSFLRSKAEGLGHQNYTHPSPK